MKKIISRREMLKAMAMSAAGLALASCAPQATSPTSVPAATNVAPGNTTVPTNGAQATQPVVDTPAAPPDPVVIWQPGDSGAVSDWSKDAVLQYVEKATNTKITINNVDWSSYVDQANVAVAGGTFPDIMGVVDISQRNILESWVKDGVIAPYEGAVAAAAPNLLAEYDKDPSLTQIKIGSKIYFQPVGWGNKNYPNAGILHVRKDLLDKYGMQPPATFDEYFNYLDKAQTQEGIYGVACGAKSGLGYNLSAFAGAYGLPFNGWVKKDSGYEYYAVQPKMYDAIMLFRQLLTRNLLYPDSWAIDNEGAREAFTAGKCASANFNGGGYIGRIQNDMALVSPNYQEYVLPAPSAGAGFQGYTSELMYTGVASLGNMKNNHPEAAARVINYLISPDGYKLCAAGIPGQDYTQDSNGNITLIDQQRVKDGFPTAAEMGMNGGHPLGLAIVSWIPQEWQDWEFLYGKPASFTDWYHKMYANQGQFQIPAYGLATATAKWTAFLPTSNDMINAAYLAVVKATSEDEAKTLFDQFVQNWGTSGGTDATAEMSAAMAQLS